MESVDIQKIIKAAHLGGEALKRNFGQSLEIKEKTSTYDLQTNADLESEKAIISSLKSDFLDYNIHTEEDGKTDNGSEYWFIVDPLDGTNNFVLGIPNFSVSIALSHKGEIVAGVVYVPMLDQTYYAIKNQGSFLNRQKLQVSDVKDFKRITIAFSAGYKTKLEDFIETRNRLTLLRTKRVLTNWSPANDFCLFASGRLEAVLIHDAEIYDYAAGKLIAEEAGGVVLELESEDRFLVTNSKEINQKVLEAIT